MNRGRMTPEHTLHTDSWYSTSLNLVNRLGGINCEGLPMYVEDRVQTKATQVFMDDTNTEWGLPPTNLFPENLLLGTKAVKWLTR